MDIKNSSLKKSIIIICVTIFFTSLMLLSACSKKDKSLATFESYKKYWEKQDFKDMYSLLSNEAKEKTTEDDFVKRYKAIYSGIEANNVKINTEKKYKRGATKISFSVVMDTLAGNVKLPGYNMTLKKEKNKWTVMWSEKLIFPDLEANDKVKAIPLYPKRGEILDRNGKGLAVNGTLNSIGIVPSKFAAVKDKELPEIAEILDMPQDKIANMVKGSTNPNWFLPIVKLSIDDKEKASKLTALEGVISNKAQGRVYPGGEAFGSLIGYIRPITAEELNNHKGEGYSAQDNIGKMGLEQVYEKRLRGESGGEIYIAKGGKDDSKKVIVRKEAKDGENIRISIDLDVQKKIYDAMKGNAGASAAINPKTGEILALVSSPSIDSNFYSTYIPDKVGKAWDASPKSPYINRFKAVYAPGSTFKLVTGAIGLKTGAIKAEEGVNITGTVWGPSKVTRVHDLGKPVNLQDAYIYSDNIYFAMAAQKIGKDNFSSGAKNFGIGESLPIDYPIIKSQLSNSGLNSDALLADTGYGQGEVLVSPLNVALIYSGLANNGDIMTPVLELKETATPKVWKEKAMSAEFVKTLTDDLVQVVENPSGTAYTSPTSSIKLLGKTGTAELKKGADDKSAEENGWFVAMNVDNPSLVVSMIIEDVKTRGESHYVVPIVKKIFEDTLKK